MSARNNRRISTDANLDAPQYCFDGRASASPEFLEVSDYRVHAQNSPNMDPSLLDSTAGWSPLERVPPNSDQSSCAESPGNSRYANRDYSLPPRKQEISSFLDDPITKTVEKLSKLTDYMVSNRGAGSSRLRSIPFKSFISPHNTQQNRHEHEKYLTLQEEEPDLSGISPPAMPQIESSRKVHRNSPMTEEQFERDCQSISKREFLLKIFYGGIAENSLKRKLWPIILGLYELNDDPEEAWKKYEDTYNVYKHQWTSITPEQENRFNAFKERKQILQRDVVRCDRKHPFYQKEENLEKIREMLMNYVMHDFDTGYIQGMTDLAAPILYVFDGDVVKSFWCFVQMLEFSKNNFKISKETILFQLRMLFKLIKISDPMFAQYLAENNSANCHFAFRWLICLFKREFVKENAEDYSQCTIVWEAIWSIHALQKLNETEKREANLQKQSDVFDRSDSFASVSLRRNLDTSRDPTVSPSSCKDSNSKSSDVPLTPGLSYNNVVDQVEKVIEWEKDITASINHRSAYVARPRTESNLTYRDMEGDKWEQLDTSSKAQEKDFEADNYKQFETLDPRPIIIRLDDVELFCLCICLSLIRRERDLIMAGKVEDCAILQHFNRLEIANEHNAILLHATTIWRWLKEDGEEEKLYDEEIDMNSDDNCYSADGFDLLENDWKLIPLPNKYD